MGSGGGKNGGTGGGGIRLTGSRLIELEGKVVSNGGNGGGGGGGGSGGILWFDAERIDGHGFAVVRGGSAGSFRIHNFCNRYNGGGSGGYARIQSPRHINRDILLNIAVNGGVGGQPNTINNNGQPGQICLAGNECSGRGVWSSSNRTCTCDEDYYGSSCLSYCRANITCLGRGR